MHNSSDFRRLFQECLYLFPLQIPQSVGNHQLCFHLTE